jgi:hypothetical protein
MLRGNLVARSGLFGLGTPSWLIDSRGDVVLKHASSSSSTGVVVEHGSVIGYRYVLVHAMRADSS